MKICNNIFLRFLVFNLQVAIFISWNLQLMQARSSRNETDMLALLKFKTGIAVDPHGAFTSWNHSLPFCQWEGINCSRRYQRVTSMVLEGKNLIGSISPFIGNLSFLRMLNLQNNSFHGPIPQEVGNLFRLQYLRLRNNTFGGEIPINLSHCSQLRKIDLVGNKLAGKIPIELGSLRMLESFWIGANNLTGEIPTSLGNLSLLNSLYVSRNMLEGKIPYEFSRLTSLREFGVAENQLSGIIPSFLFNISSISIISIAQNRLISNLPQNIGLTLQNLQYFSIADNLFSGSIPNSICNASQIERLDLSANNFVGQVPNCLGNLVSLRRLNVGENYLRINSTIDLTFITTLKNCSNLETLAFGSNNFGGTLPVSISNLSVQLNRLFLGANQISGNIPDSLLNLIDLIGLDMGDNLFTGAIPSFLGMMQKLQVLYLDGNRLSSQISSSIGNLTQLFELDLSQNKLEGGFPSSISNCKCLQYLDISVNKLNGFIPKEVFHLPSLSIVLNLSHNLFTGHLPIDVGKLINVNTLDVSENYLLGEIPTAIGSCSSLEYLFMQGNSFQGNIPLPLTSLKGVRQLDLSRNNLTGEIPKEFQSLNFLNFLLYLNLSFNDFVGEIPTGGVFRNTSAFSLMGNNKLCGGPLELHQPKCPTKGIKKRRYITLKLAIIIPGAIFCVFFMLAGILAFQRRKSKQRLLAASKEMGGLIQVAYGDLYRATSGFSTSNLIGSGSFGYVYKGFLNQLERDVAIKVLKLEIYGASKSFMAECKALRRIRHRNLVKLLTYCSSIDYKQNEFKTLVFEFMGNGSLENWLHDRNNSQSRNLNILQRLNIAIDVASALHYLHDLCETPIIHCDLKPSNILLDDELVAHVSDFGLARLLLTSNEESQSHTSSIGIRGTFGYAPPEYGMVSEASKEGDVYSYGILVFEMFTGKRPNDQIFRDHQNLHNFVRNAFPSRLAQIVDPTLLPLEMEETPVTIEIEIHRNCGNVSRMTEKEMECLLSVFKVGVACSKESARERMKMGDVAKELHLIKSNFLGVRIYG